MQWISIDQLEQQNEDTKQRKWRAQDIFDHRIRPILPTSSAAMQLHYLFNINESLGFTGCKLCLNTPSSRDLFRPNNLQK